MNQYTKIITVCDQILNTIKNCGSGGAGSPGFQPGNTCARGRGGGYPPANPKGATTLERFQRPDGSWTPERAALHEKIIAKHFEGKTPVEGQAVSQMMGGGSASGKSVTIKKGLVTIGKNTVFNDPDAIKGDLPEYNQMISKGGSAADKAASFVHAESSYLSTEIMKRAAEGNYNQMLDGTGNSALSDLEAKINILRSGGAKIEATYVSVDTKTALSRNEARAAKTGRMVPPSILKNNHKQVSTIIPQAIEKGLFDDFTLYDTNTDNQAILVARAKGKNLEIVNQNLWGRFLSKAGEEL